MSQPTPLPPFGFENHDNGDVFGVDKTYFYTCEEMLAYGRQEYERGLEDAARLCETYGGSSFSAVIRALKGKP